MLGDGSEVEVEDPESERPEIQEARNEVAAILETLPKEERVVALKEVMAEIEKEPTEPKEASSEKISTEEALEKIADCYKGLAEGLLTHGRAIDTSIKLMTKIAHEMDHLHSKTDKLHDENVHLREEHKKQDKFYDEMLRIMKDLAKALDPNESSISAIRKRLGEIEKLATEHKTSLDTSNKLLKTGLAEAASSMVAQAAKIFVQQDHSTVLTKMETVEEHVVEEQVKTAKVLGEVYEALERVRAEYKTQSRTPIILERMEAISGELKTLQDLLPKLAS
jgi:archaellum component FlaC